MFFLRRTNNLDGSHKPWTTADKHEADDEDPGD
jgi:hypothetical protein